MTHAILFYPKVNGCVASPQVQTGYHKLKTFLSWQWGHPVSGTIRGSMVSFLKVRERFENQLPRSIPCSRRRQPWHVPPAQQPSPAPCPWRGSERSSPCCRRSELGWLLAQSAARSPMQLSPPRSPSPASCILCPLVISTNGCVIRIRQIT